MKGPRYPDVCVRLAGQDGNAFSLMGLVAHALKRQGRVEQSVIDEFRLQCMSGDYDNVLCTIMDWVTVEDFED